MADVFSSMHATDLARALSRDLQKHPPRRLPRLPRFVFAAVAVVLVPRGDDFAVVLIGRPMRKGDRWSGDVAFPGGLAAGTVEASIETARREALEEVGLSLGEPVGILADRVTLAPGGRRPMRVRPIVFVVETLPELRPDPREVAAVYVPTLTELRAAAPRRIEWQLFGRTIHLDARALGEHRYWGLTASIVSEVETRIRRSA